MDIVAMTVCCVDFYPKTGKSYLGGNSLNFAAQAKASRPGNAVSIVGAVGRDAHGARIRTFLEGKGIETERLYSLGGKTATNQIVNDDSGERFGVPGTWDGGVYETFRLSESDWAVALGCDVITTHGNNPNFTELLRRKNGKALLAVDYLDAENDVPMEGRLDGVGIALISAPEGMAPRYKALSGKTGVLIVQAMGAAGSLAFHEGKTYRQAAIPVPKVVDTTGCGDSYFGAFASNYATTHDIAASMHAGAHAAAVTLSRFGGVGE